MESEVMIPVHEFCIHYNIDQSFIYSLKDSGLVEISLKEETICISENQLPQLEKIIRLSEMDINLAGIETITFLLNRIDDLQQKIVTLSNRLHLYENDY